MRYENYINGQWIEPSLGGYVDNLNPHNQKALDQFPASTPEDINLATAAAKEAFTTWSKLSYQQRGEYLLKAADFLSEKVEDIARDLTSEEGKTLPEAIGETNRAIRVLHYYSGEATQSVGDIIPSVNPKTMIYTKRVPIGPVGLITPWNFPIAIPAWKIAPALVYGNTVVIKPSEFTPKSAYHLIDALHQAGVPAGVVNCVFGVGGDIGAELVDSPDIKAISFTGSNKIGNVIKQRATILGKSVQLEMGGKNPLIVLNDANIDKAVAFSIQDGFMSTGQKCTAASRLIVEAGIYDEFCRRLLDQTNSLKVGNPLDEGTYMGPVVSARQYESVLTMIEQGKKEARLLAGGNEINTPDLKEGFYVQPTVFEVDSQSVEIARKEIFGPVVMLLKVNSFDEAVELANDTSYGLSAAIFTNNLTLSQRFVDEVEAGMVHVNSGTVGTEFQAPFGGMKSSSDGPREQGKTSIDFYTKMKTVYMD
ncbi:aldehyde dehydrogenase family protein [Metabacillus sp. B2-18]|uniref:aldehyde dehydrogenase family protein n=1 Tax=Metabacillus sp. B2-18 TaxID=2897333 RepID=UPI001E303D9E|nr:aldehyde dehydrogenase family protein [Metabacillus sp. B2-18]UGB32222.1 aldehyde dehydrogenase family protein [Metabacillus sp. B2-18]